VDKVLEAPLRAAISFLEKHRYRYAVIGGIALSQWGVIRATRDVDVRVFVPDADYASFRAIARAAFPERARPHIPENPLIVDVNIQGVFVDFLLAVPGYEELIAERSVRRDLGGWSAWVCSVEDLVIQKVAAGRAKDWMDVEALLIAQRGGLDEAYIGDWLAQFAEALDKPEILTEYQRLSAKIEALR